MEKGGSVVGWKSERNGDTHSMSQGVPKYRVEKVAKRIP